MTPEDYLRQCVTVDEMNIRGEYIRLSGDLAYWSAQLAEAKRVSLMTKVDVDRTRSALAIHYRHSLSSSGTRVTEAMIDQSVTTDPKLVAKEDANIEAEVQKARIAGVVVAIEAKKDMLISLGAHIRKENEPGPTINSKTAGFTPYTPRP